MPTDTMPIFTRKVSKLNSSQRLDQILTRMFSNYSRTKIKKLILNGQVRVNGNITTSPKEKISGNESIELNVILENTSNWEAESIPLNILYEDEAILIINKPRGLVVHPGAGNSNGTVLNALLHYFPPIEKVPRAGIIHRLDKDTTGLMVIAKTVLAYTRLVTALQERKITREYEGIITGKMISDGVIAQPIARHPIKRKRMIVHPMGKPAITHYRIIEYFRFHTLLRLRLETGRTHQIRVHMSYINHPLVGDPIYGKRMKLFNDTNEKFNKALLAFNRQALHATFLRFYHPVSLTEMEWQSPLPHDMTTLLLVLKEDFERFNIL